MNLTKKISKELVASIGASLIKIGNKEYSTNELDDILSALLDTLSSLKNIDPKVIKQMVKIQKEHKDTLSKKNFEKLMQLNKKTGVKIESDEVHERLYRHFDNNISEKTVKKDSDTLYEVKTKHKIANTNLYFEQNKVLLTMLTSNICTQNQVDRVKNLIEDGKTFTHSIKKVVKHKNGLNRIIELCRLQDERFILDEATSKRLYT